MAGLFGSAKVRRAREGGGRDDAGAGARSGNVRRRQRRCPEEAPLCGVCTVGDGGRAGRGRAGTERDPWGEAGTRGAAQTAERIAAGTEMIIARPASGPGGETQVRTVATALDEDLRGNNNEREGRAHRHERRPAQRRDLGISQYETVT